MKCDEYFAKCAKKDDVPLANREITQQNQKIEPYFENRKLLNDLSISVVMGLFIGYLAPFGMGELPLWMSVSYWVFTCIIGYFIYTPFIHFGNAILARKLSVHWHRVAISTLLASAVMSFTVPIITWLFFNMTIEFDKQFWQVFPKAVVIGGVITIVSLMRDRMKLQQVQLTEKQALVESHEHQVEQVVNEKLEQFIAQLPLEKRGDLLCLEMSDHYLKVYTDKGHHLVLMRFKDALIQLEDVEGMQTHRSWWVALSAIESMKKENRKMVLVLSNGVEVAVSRTFSDNVKTRLDT